MVVILVLGTALHNRVQLRLVEVFVCSLLFFGMLCTETIGQTDCPAGACSTQQKTGPTTLLANVRVGTSNRTSIQDRVVESDSVSRIRSIEFVPVRSGIQSMPNRESRVPSVRSTVTWVSPRAVHRTLYFNDNPLEREGKTCSPTLQPAISVFRFGADALSFPAHYFFRPRCNSCLHYAASPR